MLTKRKGLLDVKVNVNDLLSETSEGGLIPLKEKSRKKAKKKAETRVSDGMGIIEALELVARQMEATGFRDRTISDYTFYVNHFQRFTNVQYLQDISADTVYNWLESMNVSNQTKLTRLKCLKAFFSRCFDNRWIEAKFWKTIHVKVDQRVKEGASEQNVRVLLSLLDLSNFIHLRDAVAVLLMFKTGIRIKGNNLHIPSIQTVTKGSRHGRSRFNWHSYDEENVRLLVLQTDEGCSEVTDDLESLASFDYFEIHWNYE
ncbi:integrase-like protein [Baia soyae]|uniref:Integrase-like protein n=1 Tax=Baia soyae TaxID=1544746 RepID=A0A4R2SA55_9BACL|nr:integrase-like protein [Baia soyae]